MIIDVLLQTNPPSSHSHMTAFEDSRMFTEWSDLPHTFLVGKEKRKFKGSILHSLSQDDKDTDFHENLCRQYFNKAKSADYVVLPDIDIDEKETECFLIAWSFLNHLGVDLDNRTLSGNLGAWKWAVALGLARGHFADALLDTIVRAKDEWKNVSEDDKAIAKQVVEDLKKRSCGEENCCYRCHIDDLEKRLVGLPISSDTTEESKSSA